MFSVRLVSADSYQATPLPQLDPTFSEFRGAEIKYVPIVRVFGTTPTGDKTCLHLHGAFPYMYVPCTGEDNADGFAYRLAASLDAAINISLGSANSNTQHVYQVQRIAGIPFYGYHKREHQFFKVSFYNPAIMKKAIDLLQNGSVLNQSLQPYEAHIPFILQFMMDYNVHGMSMINLSSVKYRRSTQSLSELKSSNDSIITPVDELDYLPSSVERQSICKLEVDARVSDILNRKDLEKGMELNPGLAAIWEEERARRAQAGLPCDDSQLVNPKSPTRPPYCPTDSDVYQEQRLNRRLQMISQSDETSLSTTFNTTVYPAEVQDNDQLMNASNLGTFSGQNLNKTQHTDEVTSFKSLGFSQESKNSQMTNESSILDSEDLPLVDILMGLARDSEKSECIDNDSILGTQTPVFCNQDNKSDNEDDETIDFNLTCLELNSLSPWESVEKSPSQLVPANILDINSKATEVNLSENRDTDAESRDSEESRLPQLDGAGDLLSSFLESEEEENVKFQEVKRVPECETSYLDFDRMRVLNTRMSCTDEEAFIEELASSESSKSDRHSDYSPTSPDVPWPSFLPTESTVDQYALMDYIPLGSEFETDYENVLSLDRVLSNTADSTIGTNLPVESESVPLDIPLEMVLNGDPCFTQTAEMDKSDLTELQDQYASLLGSALVPDIYNNFRDSDSVNNKNSLLELKEKCDQMSPNVQNLRLLRDEKVCNLSSENVAPNIQEPDAKVYKNKYNDCKDFSRLHNDNSDYNCNLVARWEELQDLQFIPKRILKRKRFMRSRKRILRRCPALSDSMIARKRGCFRRGSANLANRIFSRENSAAHIPGDLSDTLRDSLPSEIDEKPLLPAQNDKITPTDHIDTTGDALKVFIDDSWKIDNRTDNFPYVSSYDINEKSDSKSPTSIENDFSQNILRDFFPSDPMTDVRSTLPGVQYSAYPLGENENLVTPILEDFGELVDVPIEQNAVSDLKYQSHYSSIRSHSGIPFGLFNHRHCRYSFIRSTFVQDYLFTNDSVWVVEKRKRGGCARPLSSTTCTKHCRLPFVLLDKLNVMDKKVNTKFVPVCSDKIEDVGENSDFENTCDNSGNGNLLSIETDVSIDGKLDIQNEIDTDLANNVFDDKELSGVDDLTFTQSAQISSTQNHDQLDLRKNDGPVIIKRVFEEMSQDGSACKKKRSIILKLGNRSSMPIKEKNENHLVETFNENFVQSRGEKKKRGRPKRIRAFNKRTMTESFSEKPKIHKRRDSDLLLMPPTIATEKPCLRNQIINNTSIKIGKEVTDSTIVNGESNIISSSQSESSSSHKRPEIWCSINKKNIDLSLLALKSHDKNPYINSTTKLRSKPIVIRRVETLSDKYKIKISPPKLYLPEYHYEAAEVDTTSEETLSELVFNQTSEEKEKPSYTSKDHISSVSKVQRFSDFDDSTLDLCDSIYKDDVGSNDIFENAESIAENRISITDCANSDESQQYTPVVGETTFYANKNYTIDAISQEIPQCLFEEDSITENLQKKLLEPFIESSLNQMEPKQIQVFDKIDHIVMDNESNGGCELNTNLNELNTCSNNMFINNSLINVTELNSYLSESDEIEEFTPPSSSKISRLINNRSPLHEYDSSLSRPSSPDVDSLSSCSDYCDQKRNFDEEEKISQMIESMLVLTDDEENNIDDIFDNAYLAGLSENDDSSDIHDEMNRKDNLGCNNVNKNSITSKSKYSPNKISIIRKIYLPKTKLSHKVLSKERISRQNTNGYVDKCKNTTTKENVDDDVDDMNSLSDTKQLNSFDSNVEVINNNLNTIFGTKDLDSIECNEDRLKLEQNNENLLNETYESIKSPTDSQISSAHENNGDDNRTVNTKNACSENSTENEIENERKSTPIHTFEDVITLQDPESFTGLEITVETTTTSSDDENISNTNECYSNVLIDNQQSQCNEGINQKSNGSNNNVIIIQSNDINIETNIVDSLENCASVKSDENIVNVLDCESDCNIKDNDDSIETGEKLESSEITVKPTELTENQITILNEPEKVERVEVHAEIEVSYEENVGISAVNSDNTLNVLQADQNHEEFKSDNHSVELPELKIQDKNVTDSHEILALNERVSFIHENENISADVKEMSQQFEDKLDSVSEKNMECINNNFESNLQYEVIESDQVNNTEELMKNADNVFSDDLMKSAFDCKKVSVRLVRMDVNGLNHYLGNNRGVELGISIDSNGMNSKKEDKVRKSTMNKSVTFSEEVLVFELNEKVPLIDFEAREREEEEQERAAAAAALEENNEIQIEDNDDEFNDDTFDYNDELQKSEKQITNSVEDEYESIVKLNPIITLDKNECSLLYEATKKDDTFNNNSSNLNKLSHLNGVVNTKQNEVPESEMKKRKRVKSTSKEMNSNKTILKKKIATVECVKKLNQERKFNVSEYNSVVSNERALRDQYTEEMHISSINKVDKKVKDILTKDKSSLVMERRTNKKQRPIKGDYNKSPMDESTIRRTELACKRKRNVLPKQTQLNLNTTQNDIAFVNSSLQEVCERKPEDNNRLLHTYRMLTSYRNKVHTLSIDQRMVFTRVTISNQEFHRKTVKEEFLEGIGLYPLKSRGCGWQPEHTITGFIQLEQPRIILQRLTPSVLKRYGYTRRFKSNRLGKRFKMDANRFTIPAYDGAADLSSSDSEPDTDMTLESLEKRVCVYRRRRSTEREAVVTPRKRKGIHDENDAVESKRSTPKRGIVSLRNSCCSPNRTNMLKSPGLSKNYSPLKIIVTSPKVYGDVPTDSYQSRDDSHHVDDTNSAISISVTPRRRTALHENLLRGRITSSLSANQQGSNGGVKKTARQQLLDIPSTSSCDVESIFPTSVDEYPCVNKSQDILSNIKDTTNVRKNLFPSIENNLRIAEISCCATEEQHKDHIHKVSDQQNDKDELVESSDDENTVIFEKSSRDFELKYSPSSPNEEHVDNDNDDLCNVTFTQYLSSQLTKQPTSSTNNWSQSSLSQRLCIITPKFNPPTTQRIIDTMELYKIPKCRNLQPFFSVQSDAPGQKELAHRMLKVPGKGLADLLVFKSSVENITGINRWRRMKVNEFPSSQVFKSSNIRQSLAGHSSVVITPIVLPPSSKNVIKWVRARNYLKKKKEQDEAKEKTEVKAQEEKLNKALIERGEASEDSSDCSIIEPSPEKIVESNLSKVLGLRSGTISKKLFSNNTRGVGKPFDSVIEQKSPNNSLSTGSSNVTGEAAPSLFSILEKSNLFKEDEVSKHLGISCGQIECLTNPNRSNASNENRQKAKTLITYQFITILCVEVHVVTRQDLLPDPQHDSISALFYAVQSDVPPTSNIKPLEHGVIAVADQSESKLGYTYGSSLPFTLTVVANEEELFNAFIDLVTRIDPEIFIGWEIESLSWGYIFQRASRLGINLSKRISRIPSVQCKWETQEVDLDALAEMKLPGRIVLDIWRIMRGEISLLTYTFENVMYHVMNERFPCPSFKALTTWWEAKQTQTRWKVVQHYSTKVLGVLRILEQLDIIGRTSEHARLFGIQFYEVFSRGSQYRVESIMLRLAKPLNYIPVSPSPLQRARMRAMEALPLIMEPESMFYSDPVIVLDFQSLYPSIIIAHNYCFSTCLGRIEHIGQSEPYEFGAHVLRINKSTAMKLQGKVNYAPCGVAFVKPEVRLGILPRMLMEILETRFMVKKAMKDHSKDDKLLQRVLHSRQHGLKYLANVTYGYTAANFSGRMPCIELGDSVISKAKETLERAIKLVESTPRWGARVVYGDTDSLFILVPGKSKDDAFKIGNEIADAVTASNLTPIKLKFEKVLFPTILQTKKRYCGYMYETPDQKEPTYLAKGIETVRRDGCPAVSKILEKSLRILFDTKDVSLVKKYVTRQLDKVLNGKVSIQDLTFAKEFRGLKGYKDKACVPALELTRRLMKKDPRACPRRGERVRYIVVAGAPNQALIHCVRSPWELINDPGLRPNGTYYVTRVIIPPLNRCLNLMGVDVNAWYREMPHRHILDNPVALPHDRQKQTIFQYFGTIICASCGRSSNRGICDECIAHPTETLITLNEKLRSLERTMDQVTRICQSCIGRGDIVDCCSLDCPVLYRRTQTEKELSQSVQIRKIIEEGDNFEF
ncbi:uncharacterized protein DNApol-zeta isoform X2 [Chelonus insularis]|uniref:uncharacterized protein DNApol-zeta isoform X2 n=1 Tax=Chelonus insularis TaxID=460826 RepID=UPI00158B1303|nr:uncharacterized protein LOC118067255 isoform X2 [Chelonus insularis]